MLKFIVSRVWSDYRDFGKTVIKIVQNMNTERRQSGYIGEGQGFREISDSLAYSKLIGEKFFECVHAYAVQSNLNPT